MSNRVIYASSYCQVMYTVTSQGPGGFGANILVQNTSPSAWAGWTLAFTFLADQRITLPGWNGTFTQSGQQVTITNVSSNGNVAVNGSVNPGFNGSWTTSNPVPSSFSVNGNVCHRSVFSTPTVPGSPPTFTPRSTSTPRITPAPNGELAPILTRGNPNRSQVALTFDDGPSQYTTQILATLQRFGVKATFFPIGSNDLLFPNLLQQDLAAGMVVGNHTYTHSDLTMLSFSAILKEMTDTQNTVVNATGTRPTLFRPPFGSYNNDVLKAAAQLGMTVVIWSAVANDWDNPPPSADLITSRILGAAENGAIFLLHEGGGDRTNTVAALPALISGLQARGFTLVTLPQILADLHT